MSPEAKVQNQGEVKPTPAVPAAGKGAAAAAAQRFIRRVRITNRQSQNVTLLANGGVLAESEGLGARLVQAILDGAFPIRVTLGKEGISPMDVRREAVDADRLVLLIPEDTGAAPGTLRRNAPSDLVSAAGDAAGKVVTFKVQPGEVAGALDFGPVTNDALCGQIVKEMTA